MPTKEEFIKFIQENDFDENIIGKLFGILDKSKVENKEEEIKEEVVKEPEEEPKEETREEKRAKVEEIFGKF